MQFYEDKRDYDQIPLDLPYIISHPGSVEYLALKARDELFITKFDVKVKIRGAVLLATQVLYQEKNNLKGLY